MLSHQPATFLLDAWAIRFAAAMRSEGWTVAAFPPPSITDTLLAMFRRLDALTVAVGRLAQANAALQQPPRPAPRGYFSAADVAAVLGIPPDRRAAFTKTLHRRRAAFASAAVEIADRPVNSPAFLYDAASPEIRKLARRYGADC